MKIEVTEEMIKEGKPNSPETCAVALAINKKLPFYKKVMVAYSSVIVRNKFYGTKVIELPKEAKEFIWTVDSGEIPEPITFELEL